MLSNKPIGDSVSKALREIAHRNPGARTFFEKSTKADLGETSIDDVSKRANIDRISAIALAKELAESGCANYVVGRRGKETRLEWTHPLRVIANAALGEDVPSVVSKTLSTIDAAEAIPPDPASFSDGSRDEGLLSIGEAKRRLAKSLDVSIEAIEIIIRS